MTDKSTNPAVHDLRAVTAALPATSETMIVDTRLTDEAHASARVFRVYHPLPAHYHATCDEYLLVLSGRGLFFLEDQAPFEAKPGQMIFFRQRTVHGIRQVLEEPLVFFAVDTPRRDPRDIIFVDPEDGTVASFVQTVPGIP